MGIFHGIFKAFSNFVVEFPSLFEQRSAAQRNGVDPLWKIERAHMFAMDTKCIQVFYIESLLATNNHINHILTIVCQEWLFGWKTKAKQPIKLGAVSSFSQLDNAETKSLGSRLAWWVNGCWIGG